MGRVKVFIGSEDKALESRINEWLKKNPDVTIASITQSGAGGPGFCSFMVLISYTEVG